MGDNKSFIKFLFEGDIKSAWSYVVTSVIKPRTKQLIWEATTGAIRTLIYKDSLSPDGVGGGIQAAMKYWNQPLGKSPAPAASNYNPNPLTSDWSPSAERKYDMHSYINVVYKTESDAKLVLTKLREILFAKKNTPGQAPVVRVSDMLSFSGVRWEYTCQEYGWDNLDAVEIHAVLDNRDNTTKYKIMFPPASPIKDLI